MFYQKLLTCTVATALMLTTLLPIAVVVAQDEDLTQVYDGEQFRFLYPADWSIIEETDSVVRIRSPRNAVTIGFNRLALVPTSETESDGLPIENPDYSIGFVAGMWFLQNLAELSVAQYEVELDFIDFGSPQFTEIGHYDAVYTILSIESDFVLVLLYNDREFLAQASVTVHQDRFEGWRDLVFSILNTLEVREP